MKKQLHSVLFACLSLFAAQSTFAEEGVLQNRGCGSMEYKEMQEKANPAIKALREQIEEQVRDYIMHNKTNPTPQAVLTLPLVFHVVYNGAAENVSDNCLNQTLIALNTDFRKQNTDFLTKTPAVFQPLGADCEIQFCLATKDPTGAATNGITRTSTTVSVFSGNDAVKYTAQGGKNIWDRTKYVNLWVCDLGTQLLGYAQFPGGPAATDGVVCHYKYLVQTGGCGATPYEKGRTTVHELGHWFGLKHIWGDANCGNDGVADTPTQQAPNYNCPAHPHVTCGNSGDMFMNYMDYVPDACMVMFSAGQKAVMTATMNGSRASLKTSAATNCASGTGVTELNISDYVSIFPNPSAGSFSINMNIPGVSNADMTIYNALGEAVLEKKITVPSGGNVDVDLDNSPEGMYIVKVKTTEGTITKKIVISK